MPPISSFDNISYHVDHLLWLKHSVDRQPQDIGLDDVDQVLAGEKHGCPPDRTQVGSEYRGWRRFPEFSRCIGP